MSSHPRPPLFAAGSRSDTAVFVADPLSWLVRASRQGDFAVVDQFGPIASRAEACGTVAIFGQDAVRQVLGDIETFGMPVSVSARYQLPPVLANLNSALFSMTGPRHRSRQRLLATFLGPAFDAEHGAAIEQGVTEFLRDWSVGAQVPLLTEMRRLARLVAEQVVLGTVGANAIGVEIQRYFDLRREYGSRSSTRPAEDLDLLIAQGTRVDGLLRAHIRAVRSGTDECSILGQLCRQRDELAEDELVAHANILFMSSSEPIATAMTWILLGLSQRPELRAAVRNREGTDPDSHTPVIHGVVHEFLRLVPPSAVMVRLTRREAEVAGVLLPPSTEVLISPFAEHRRPEVFPHPLKLMPERWVHARPGPGQFLPFGTGARSCLGRRIALATLERCTRALIAAFDPVLCGPQRLDWLLNVTLQPAGDPVIRLHGPGEGGRGGMLSGPAATLLQPETSLDDP